MQTTVHMPIGKTQMVYQDETSRSEKAGGKYSFSTEDQIVTNVFACVKYKTKLAIHYLRNSFQNGFVEATISAY